MTSSAASSEDFELRGMWFRMWSSIKLAHEAIDRAAGCGQALQRFGARLVFVKCAKHAFELADDFLGARDEVELFARSVRHFACIPYGGMVSRFRSSCNGSLHSSAMPGAHFNRFISCFVPRAAFIVL